MFTISTNSSSTVSTAPSQLASPVMGSGSASSSCNSATPAPLPVPVVPVVEVPGEVLAGLMHYLYC